MTSHHENEILASSCSYFPQIPLVASNIGFISSKIRRTPLWKWKHPKTAEISKSSAPTGTNQSCKSKFTNEFVSWPQNLKKTTVARKHASHWTKHAEIHDSSISLIAWVSSVHTPFRYVESPPLQSQLWHTSPHSHAKIEANHHLSKMDFKGPHISERHQIVPNPKRYGAKYIATLATPCRT